MEVHHYDGIVLFTGGISAVPPMLRRRMTSRENKFEIFCVGDFGEIESGCRKEVNRQEKGPEVAQPAAPTSFCVLCVPSTSLRTCLCGQFLILNLPTLGSLRSLWSNLSYSLE